MAAPTGPRRRGMQLLAGGLAIVLSAGWWVAIVALWPVGSRPMIDGSPTNNIFNLITGYNGLGRIFGASGPGKGGGQNFSGATGPLRLFNDLMGGQASWLLPAALLALLIGLWTSRRAPRTDRTRAAMLLWGGWLLVSGAVFSVSSSVIHTYYTVALAPAIAALVAITAAALWRTRRAPGSRAAVALTVLVTAAWSWVLLDRTPQWHPWLRPLVLAGATIAAIGLLAAPYLRRFGPRVTIVAAALAVVACLAGPAAYSAQTLSSAHTGSIVSAGPTSATSGGGPGGAGGRAGGQSKHEQRARQSAPSRRNAIPLGSRRLRRSERSILELATSGEPVMAIGGFDNQGGNLTLTQFKQYVARGQIHYYIATTNGGAPAGGAAGAGGSASASGGVPSGSTPGSGGLPGAAPPSGASPPAGASPGAPGGQGASSTNAITSWVKAHYKTVTVGGQTVYDLAQARA